MRGGIAVQRIVLRSWMLDNTLTYQRKGRIFKCNDCAAEKKTTMERNRSSAITRISAEGISQTKKKKNQHLSRHLPAVSQEKTSRSSTKHSFQKSLNLFFCDG